MTTDHEQRRFPGRPLAALLGLALALGMLLGGAGAARAADGDAIAIIHSNDVHCAGLATSASAIGYAGIAQAKLAAEATYGEGNVTLVDAGDAIQGQPIGTLTQGGDLVDLMDAAAYDVAVPGNHEFDYGIPRLQELAQGASYPYVTCNVLNTETGQQLFAPYELIEYAVGGETVRVAYVGITTPTTLTSEAPSIFEDEAGKTIWSFYEGDDGQNLYQQVQAAVDDACETGEADYVIAVAHLGKDASSSVPAEYTSTAVVANTTGIDGVIDGHTHLIYNTELQNKDGESIPVAQCGTQFKAYGTMTITPDGDPGPEDVASSVTVAADQAEPVAQDATVAAAVQAKQDALAGELDKVVGTSTVGLSVFSPNSEGNPWYWTARMRETNLGDYVADAYRACLDADVALINGGGIRAPQTTDRATTPLSDGTFGFAPGDFTYNDFISINSFGNTLSLVEVTGQNLLDALEYSVRALTPAMDDETEAQGSFLQVSGIEFTANISIPTPVVENDDGGFGSITEGMARRVSDVTVGGAPIDPDATYTLASIPLILSASGDYTMFGDCTYLKPDAGLDYEALVSYLQDDLGGTIGEAYANPAGQGRIDLVTSGTPVVDTVAVYRLYNRYGGEHLYTANEVELQTLVGLGWQDEGVCFTEYAEPDDPEAAVSEYVPVYRLWNPNNGGHFYTASTDEARALTGDGWLSEGIAWYGPAESPLPVHRLYNPYMTADGGLGNHLWTLSEAEVDGLVALGWQDEGTAWQAVAAS